MKRMTMFAQAIRSESSNTRIAFLLFLLPGESEHVLCVRRWQGALRGIDKERAAEDLARHAEHVVPQDNRDQPRENGQMGKSNNFLSRSMAVREVLKSCQLRWNLSMFVSFPF
jgi:hypothetical protein